MHRHLNLVLDHWIVCAVEERLGSGFFDLDDLFNHSGYLLLGHFLHIQARVPLDLSDDGQTNWVHVDQKLRDVLVVDNSL